MATSTSPRGRTLLDRSLIAVEILAGLAVVVAVVGEAYGAAPTLFFLLGGLALAFSLYVLARMLGALSDPSLDATEGAVDERRAALEHEKTLILQGIKELEVDAGLGKVDPQDYQHLRGTAEADALAIIRKIQAEDETYLSRARTLVRDRLGEDAARGPEPVAAPGAPQPAPPSAEELRATDAAASQGAALADLFSDALVRFRGASRACGHCEADNPAGARYCVACGRPGEPEEAAAQAQAEAAS